MTTILVGNVARATVIFTPASGVCVLANVSARSIDSNGTVTTETVVAQGDPNTFYCDIVVDDADPEGVWTVRFECSSPKISKEAQFTADGSIFPAP